MKTHILDCRGVLAEMKSLLAQKPALGKPCALEQAVDALYRHRDYSAVAVYALIGERLVPQASRGSAPSARNFVLGQAGLGATGVVKTPQGLNQGSGDLESKTEFAVPIRIAGRVLGILGVQRHPAKAVSYKDRVLLKQVALLLARYFTSGGKATLRKLRIAAQPDAAASKREAKLQPVSERSVNARKAAVGEALRP